jgi:four helix bundle protein
MGKKGYKDLVVWQKGKNLAILVYRTTREGDLNRDLGLRDQLRRSAVSIASNIAEGDERDSDKEAVRFFYVAKGSLAELRTQIEISYEIGYLRKEDYEIIDGECVSLAKMIGSLIKARRKGSLLSSKPKASSP